MKTDLLDTNIIIDFFARDLSLTDKLSKEKINIPAIVVGELYYGAMPSSRQMQRVGQIEKFIENFEIINVYCKLLCRYKSFIKKIRYDNPGK